MAYQATVIQVMIASPGDVTTERDIARDVIHEWNNINSASAGVMLAPCGWETHVSPGMGARPQEIINADVLRHCDLLIGVFWTRIGSPTGEAISGTVEEIERHIGSGKPAMIYFSCKPVAPQSIDSSQYESVSTFKEWCMKSGIIHEFDTEEEFRQLLHKDLQLKLIKDEYLRSSTSLTRPDSQIESDRQAKALSQDARELLRSAAKRESGVITKLRYIGGVHLQAGDQTFGKGDRRKYARWERALEVLMDDGLVVERGYRDDVFELTHKGWTAADAP